MKNSELTESDNDEWLDILDNKLILKRVLQEGDKDVPRPERGCRVRINIETKLKDTEEKVESESLQDAEIFVGDCDLFHALDLIIPLMHAKEKCEVIIAPRFAYGEKGRNPDIPENSTLKCIIELISVDWLEELTELEAQERFKIALRKKERGNFFFNRGEWFNSISSYKRAIEFLDAGQSEEGSKEDLQNEVQDLKATCYNNLAQAQMKIEAYDKALDAVNEALKINEMNSKALFRKGKILEIKGELEEAVSIWEAASRLEPGNQAFKRELEKTKRAMKKQIAEEKVMFRRMLQLDETNCDKVPAKLSECRSHRSWLTYPRVILISSTAIALLGAFLYNFYLV